MMTMGRLGRVLLVAAMVLPLGGCPYNSEVPIDDGARAPFDGALLGEWRPLDEKEATALLTVVKLGAREYAMVTTAQGENPGIMRAYLSEVGGVRLLNVEELGIDGSKGFSFFRYAFSKEGGLEASAVSDEAVKQKFKTSAELKGYLAAHMKDDKLFEAPMRFIRPMADAPARPSPASGN